MKLRSKSIMSLLYVALLSIPLVSILSRVIYVQANKNAYQSYEGATEQNITNEIVNNTNEFVEGNTYYFRQYNNVENRNYNEATNNIIASELTYNLTDYDNVRIGFYASGTSVYVYLRPTSDLTQLIYQSDMRYVDTSITFVFESISSQFSSDLLTYIYQKEYNSNYYMDNVFEYSVSKLVSDNNFGQLNFFEWFSGFLLNNEQQNNLYVHFANWYLCYAMLISLMQILFLCLMWFVNFSRKMLDRGMNYDW